MYFSDDEAIYDVIMQASAGIRLSKKTYSTIFILRQINRASFAVRDLSSLVEIGPLVLNKKTFKSRYVMFVLIRHVPLFVNESPLSKDALCQVCLLFTWWLWRRFLKIVIIFLLFRYYLPWNKGCLVELARWFWSRRQKWEQFTKTSTTTTPTKTTLFTNVQQDM